MGFGDMREVVHKAASRKGGRIKTDKGLNKLSPERRREIAAMGGHAKHAANQNRKGSIQIKESESANMSRLADVLGALDE